VVADLALFSFLKIIAKINKFAHIRQYSRNPLILAHISDYKVKMGFGLHYGWAIEGPIGSNYKIDASYLSPNVNIASRLEAATKQYGVSILLSGKVQTLLSERVKMVTREIDRVTVKGSVQPLDLYTVMLNLDHLPETIDRFQGIEKNEKKEQRHSEKVAVVKRVIGGAVDSDQLFLRDEDIREMRKTTDPVLERKFRKGYQAYLGGDWRNAIQLLE